MPVQTAQKRNFKHPGQDYVIDITSLAGKESRIFFSPNFGSEIFRSHVPPRTIEPFEPSPREAPMPYEKGSYAHSNQQSKTYSHPIARIAETANEIVLRR